MKSKMFLRSIAFVVVVITLVTILSVTALAAIAKPKSYDDALIGKSGELNKFFYAGNGWGIGSAPACYKGQNHYVWMKGSFYTFTFSGTKFAIYSDKENFFGKSDVYIDGKKVATIDQYGPGRVYSQLAIFKSKVLKKGKHTLKVVNTNVKDKMSVGTCISVDRIDVWS